MSLSVTTSATCTATARSFWTGSSGIVDSLCNELEHAVYLDSGNPTLSSLSTALDRNATDTPIDQLKAAYWRAYLSYYNSHDREAAISLDYILASPLTADNNYVMRRAEILKLSVDWRLENLRNFYPAIRSCEKYMRECGDSATLAFTLRIMSNYLRDVGEERKALSCVMAADTIYRNTGLTRYRTKNLLNVATLKYMNGDEKESREILQSLISDPVAKADTGFYVNLIFSLAHVSNNHTQSFELANRALELSSQKNDPQLIAKSSMLLGVLYFYDNKSDSSLKYLWKANAILSKEDNHDLRMNTLQALYELKAQKHQWDSAFIYQSRFLESRDSVQTRKSRFEVLRIEYQMEQDNYETRLDEAAQKIQTQRLILILVIALSCTALVAMLFGTLNLRKKFRLEKLTKQLKEKEVESRDKEIGAYALNLSQKVELINNMSARIDDLVTKGNLSDKDGDTLRNCLDESLATEDNWVYLKLNFEKKNPGYLEALQQKYPRLTDGDLRICVYILMGFTNKQIAGFLSVLPDSIKTSRYRIRKKLGIDNTTRLEDFLRNFKV